MRSATNPLGHTTHYTYDGLGNQTSHTDALGNVFRSRVNALGLLVASETPQPDGTTATERYWYDNTGNLTLVQDAEGREIHYTYDVRGNLLQTSQPVSPVETFTTSYTYDREGRLLTSATGDAVHSYGYDSLGNLIRETDALGQSSTHTYDPAGNLISSVNRNGVETTFAYDALSREILRYNEQDGLDAATANTYSPDGLLLESANGEAAYTYQYDSFGRVTEIKDATGLKKVYTYDKGDRVTSLQVYQGSVLEMDLSYEYDAAGQLTAVVSDGVRTTYAYDAAGRLTEETNGLTGVQTQYFYTPAGQLSVVLASCDGELLKGYAYGYDRSGNQTLKVENGEETRYYYDAVGRLETAELPDGTTQHFIYDARGNRIEMAELRNGCIRVTTYGYDLNNRLLYSESDTETCYYEYDACGNQTLRIVSSDGAARETKFVWNGAGQLAYSVDENGVSSSYSYGPDGLRTNKSVGGEETRFFYENGSILLELDGGSRITAKTTRGLRLISRETLTGEYGYLLDGHGDVTALVGADGKIVLDYAYDPFGNETTYQPGETAQLNNPFRYCGEYWDAETQTYYLRARQYDPATGRFLSEDTHWNPTNAIQGDDPHQLTESTYAPNILAIIQSSNLYVYTANMPIIYKDSDGKVMVGIIAAGAAIGGVVNAGINIYNQIKESKKVKTLNWSSAGISFVAGAISGGVAASPIGLIGQIGINALISGTESALQDKVYGRDIDWELVGIKAGIGGLVGLVGGNGAQVPKKTVYGKLVSGGGELAVLQLTYSSRVKAEAAAKAFVNGLTKGYATQIIVDKHIVEIRYYEE